MLTDLPDQWRVLRPYQRRFRIQAGFRSDKRRGWQWEDSQVRDPGHQARLLLAMAWASLVARRLGEPTPGHARESLFTLGPGRARQWLYRPDTVAPCWHLPDPLAERWADQWRSAQGHFPRPAVSAPEEVTGASRLPGDEDGACTDWRATTPWRPWRGTGLPSRCGRRGRRHGAAAGSRHAGQGRGARRQGRGTRR